MKEALKKLHLLQEKAFDKGIEMWVVLYHHAPDADGYASLPWIVATLKIETAFKSFYFDIYTWESEEEARKKLDQKIEEIANLIEQA